MDHVIDYILGYMQSEEEDFRNEWASGEYEKISDCPTYHTIKAYCAAIRELNKDCGIYPMITPMRIVRKNKKSEQDLKELDSD